MKLVRKIFYCLDLLLESSFLHSIKYSKKLFPRRRCYHRTNHYHILWNVSFLVHHSMNIWNRILHRLQARKWSRLTTVIMSSLKIIEIAFWRNPPFVHTPNDVLINKLSDKALMANCPSSAVHESYECRMLFHKRTFRVSVRRRAWNVFAQYLNTLKIFLHLDCTLGTLGNSTFFPYHSYWALSKWNFRFSFVDSGCCLHRHMLLFILHHFRSVTRRDDSF